MITLLSPSKGQDFASPACTDTFSLPTLLEQSQLLISELRMYDSQGLQKLMSISENIAQLNSKRYKDFSVPFSPQNSKQALCAFIGDVYGAMDVDQYSDADFEFAQKHLRILSGLYGCLRPLDLIQPYRLEMKTKLANKRGADLYSFWGRLITEEINKALQGQKMPDVVNLASQEYFKAVKKDELAGDLIDVAFKDIKDGKARVVAIFAKKARGMMADFIIKKQIENPQALQDFDYGGYCYDQEASTKSRLTFVRRQPSSKKS